MEQIVQMFVEGGPFMYPILLCAIFGATIALERLIFIFFRASINAAGFMATIQRHVLEGQVEQAVRLCNAESGAVLPRVIKAGLLRATLSEAEINDAMEEQSREVFPLINNRLSYLPTIANVSTLLGLLGTIQGLILSFHAVAEQSSEMRATALSQGIAVAMYTTFFGLLVSIPVLVLHSVVAARASLLLDEIDHHSLKLANLLVAWRRGQAAAR